ncbi:5-hydroxytryptamine receptor 3A-like [Trichomycterus rosablanca]|uniref:5-hydroxytryptamine receptor 3A-like n=1 Tax=Trichomycterus rosablanca TaxID=2290929 RepID=UPI002F35DB9A
MQSRLVILMGCVFVLLLHDNEAARVCTANDVHVLSLYKDIEAVIAPWKKIRPVLNPTDIVNIKLGFTITGILGVNEKDGLLTIFIIKTLDWFLPFLSWNTSCGAQTISYPVSDLWLPDIEINEFMEEDKSPQSLYLLLNYTGGVHVVERKRVVSSCKMNIYKFPFDTQNCTLTFSSVIHEGNELKLYSKSNEYILRSSTELMKANVGWKLMYVTQKSSVYNLTSKRSYSAMVYNIILKREPSLYVVNLLVPSCFLSMLDLFSFYMPAESVDRSAFKMTLILGYTVFLLITNDLLPDNSAEPPLINVCFSLSLALMVASLLETMFIVNLSNRNSSNYHRKVPRWLNRLVLHYLARFLFMSHYCTPATLTFKQDEKASAFYLENTLYRSEKAMAAAEAEQTELTKEAAVVDELKKLFRELVAIRQKVEIHLSPIKDVDEWKIIAKVIDRLLFVFYVIFVIVSYVTIITLWVVA